MKSVKNILPLLMMFAVTFSTSIFAEPDGLLFPPYYIAHDKKIEVSRGKCVSCDCTKFETIQDALSYLNKFIISPEAMVTIELTQSDKDYDTIKVAHPNGDRISIQGNCHGNGSPCTIKFKPGVSGIVVADGNKLGSTDTVDAHGDPIIRSVANLILDGDSGLSGIFANNNATIVCGPNVKVSNFGYGIWAGNGSYIFANGIEVYSNQYDGIYATHGATINVDGAVSIGNKYRGIVATRGSMISAAKSRVENNGEVGIYSLFRSTILAHGATVNNTTKGAGNPGHGFLVLFNSAMEADRSKSNNNDGCGYRAAAISYLLASDSLAENNKGGSYCGNDVSYSIVNNSTTTYNEFEIVNPQMQLP